ncbi:PREDICTED: replication [Prunus dulcis]|uniref:Replication protein A subunit n=1 Tax=Prunus dulcis TaxID=3755 RepID=A0A5E4E3R1_PRUDU|nr:replication protein A 70 kDa DNA-binding subunit A [Prunus dulcis]VVA10265.1 PREDICTED: replication [Prunus dulcis]
MPVQLTPNAIAAISAGDLNSKPLVQVIDIKLLGTQERYRFIVSDAVSCQHAMVATQLNDRIKTSQVKKGSIIQLTDYISNYFQNHKIIVVLNMETIILDSEIIGDPKPYVESGSAAQKALPNNNFEHSVRDSNNYMISQESVRNVQSLRPTSHSGTSLNRGPNLRPTFHSENSVHNMANFRPTVQPPYQPPPQYKNHGSIVKNEAPARIIPINALNPYQGRWAIKARVTAKGDPRRYNNARGDGKVFSFDLLDSEGGEIRVTCFNAVLDRFYDTIEVGRVYLISKGSLKPAQKNFNHLKNDWEITLDASSTVELCPDEDGSIPEQKFSFRHISEIENVDSNSIVDIIGIVISVNPSVPIMRKNGMETQRRIVNLRDWSGKSVELTLWGDVCNREGQRLEDMLASGLFPVLAVKAGKINDFSGKSVGTIHSTQLFINPDIPDSYSLREWFDQGGKDTASVSISKDIVPGGIKNEIRKTVSQIKDEGLGRSDKPDWVTVKATISFIKTDSFCYTACPLMIGDRQCNKKVSRSGNRGWQCDRCDQEFEECDYRYLLQAQIQDNTGLTWATAFQESGEEILGCSAKDLYLLKEQDDSRFGDIVRSSIFNQFLFRLKIKEETYGDEQKVKITVVKADKVNYSSESKYMLDMILKFSR